MSDLKDCPFCGGKPIIDRMGSARASMVISCEDCGATVECGSNNLKFSDWNSRSNVVERLEARVKELEGILEPKQVKVFDFEGHIPHFYAGYFHDKETFTVMESETNIEFAIECAGRRVTVIFGGDV
jgi:Lar family restriction alleviation protein